MADFNRRNGATSNTFRARLESAYGTALTGLAFNSAGLIISTIADNEATATAYTQAAGNIEDITTLGTFAAPTASKCRFKQVDATNHPGDYEVQIADARMAVASAKALRITFSGAASLLSKTIEIQLEPVPANLKEIDQGATSGNNATLNLKQLNIVNSTGSAVVASATGSNGHGITASGNGSGHGVLGTGGATGAGVIGIGGATSGAGIYGLASAGNSHGIQGAGEGGGSGVRATGGATGSGVVGVGGGTFGHGFFGTATSGNGILGSGGTNGHGLALTGAGSGEGISATGGATGNGAEFIGGASSGAGIVATGTAGNSPGIDATGHGSAAGAILTAGSTGSGLHARSGTGATGYGIYAQARATAGNGITTSGTGVGHGIESIAGDTGDGIHAENNGTSGHGFHALSQVGDGIRGYCGDTGQGIHALGGVNSGPGFKAVGVGGNSAGLQCVGVGTALGVEATGDPRLRGSITTATGLTTTTFRDSTKSATNDFYNNCAVAFTSGTLSGLAFRVLDYDGATGGFTVSDMPTAPSNGDTFVILGRVTA